MPRPTILHLSADFPDSVRNRTTLAVYNLIAAAADFEHVVISLKRQSLPWRTYLREDRPTPCGRVFAYGYWALPLGLAHFASMWIAARRIHALLAEQRISFDVIHAHKLSFEGLIAWFLARWLKVPFVVSLRGEAETKIVRYKPTYRPIVRRIAQDASLIFAVSMWFVPELRRVAPGTDPKIRPLPNLVSLAGHPKPLPAPTRPRFISILDLNVYRKKGFHWLIAAFAITLRTHPDATLDVVGWSNEHIDAELRDRAAAAGCGHRIRFRGVRSHAQILDELPQYSALLLPSVNETFGMVYLEALFAGIPVLYTRGTGIDGHLDGLAVGIGVRAGSIKDIAAAIDDLSCSAAQRRSAIRAHADALAARFDQGAIIARYTSDMKSVIEETSRPETIPRIDPSHQSAGKEPVMAPSS